MYEDDRRKLSEHNKRVRVAAYRMPTPGLRNSFKALAYRADRTTSTDEGCTVHGVAMRTIAKLAMRSGYERSQRQLWKDLALFERHGVAKRTPGKRTGRRQEPSTIYLSFTVTLPEAEELACRESMMAELAGWHGEPEGTRPATVEPRPVERPAIERIEDYEEMLTHLGITYEKCRLCQQLISEGRHTPRSAKPLHEMFMS